jgi:hypothetical protein
LFHPARRSERSSAGLGRQRHYLLFALAKTECDGRDSAFEEEVEVIADALFVMAEAPLLLIEEAALALLLTATGPRAVAIPLPDAIALGAMALSARVATVMNIASLLFMVCSSFVFFDLSALTSPFKSEFAA